MPPEQSYIVGFSPAKELGRNLRGSICVKASGNAEDVKISINDEDSGLSWSVPEFAQFRNNLAEALVLIRSLKTEARGLSQGQYQAKFGSNILIFTQDGNLLCSIRLPTGQCFCSLDELGIVKTLSSFLSVDIAIEQAVATFRRLRRP